MFSKLLDIKTLLLWFPLTVVITFFAGLVYVAVQHDIRMSANDPQIQIAEDNGVKLANGQSPQSLSQFQNIDISQSLAPFIIVYDTTGKPVFSSAELDGKIPHIPPGVFPDAKQKSELRFTWQHKEDVRSAVVIDYFSGKTSGYVLAGRSLREVEKRENDLTEQVFAVWMVLITSTYVFTWLVVKLLQMKYFNR